jgi:hypothetical protein
MGESEAMISQEQMERAERDAVSNAAIAFNTAKSAERRLESYAYLPAPQYDPVTRNRLLVEYKDADYQAEMWAWILNLIREARKQ